MEMSDETHSEADSNRAVAEKRQAEILDTAGDEEDPDAYLVRYADGSVEYEPATPANVALFEDDLYPVVQGYSQYDVDGTTVELDADVGEGQYVITVGDREIVVPSDRHRDVIEAHEADDVGEALHDVFLSIIEGQVRRDVVEDFLEQYPDDRIDVTPSGWVIDDTFLVTYEGENYLADHRTVYVRSGSEMIEADESKPAVNLDFDVSGRREITTASGETVEATETEQTFLATVECLLFPEEYLDASLVDEVEHLRLEEGLDDVQQIADTAHVSGFTDSKTGNYHDHGFNKHRASQEVAEGNVRDELGLTEEAVDRLYFNDYDHAAPHELLARRQELENAPFDLFADDGVRNDNVRRWKAIENAKSNAPVADETKRKIREMFGDDQRQLMSY